MRLDDSRESKNVEDRRGMGGGGFGGGRVAIGGGAGIVVVLIALLLGVDPSVLIQGGGPGPGAPPAGRMAPGPAPSSPQAQAERQFVARVLGELEDVWRPVFQQSNRPYRDPVLVLFSGGVQTGCGPASSQVGPFYCPADQRLYIDPDYLARLQRQIGAPGDFAAAYVIAHEVGHHVQQQLGILQRVDSARRGMSTAEANQMQVRIELQADCFAGFWARRAEEGRRILERGDLEEAIAAAHGVGDDTLQRQAQGHVVPERFTHGTSAQRVRWFRRGFESGDVRACDTFAADRL
ncbi:MAG TPA: neutral zinc metallopeptidase [Acetobacteraceae bacterium]|nr:neutral zinc metallopeptidase [Acetobacteraceae bacterium]